jgi:hypothetical protein
MSHEKQPDSPRKIVLALLWMLALVMIPCRTNAQTCNGDCDGSGVVRVDEAVLGVGIALGMHDLSQCEAADSNQDGELTVDELVSVTASILEGCPQRLAFISANLFPEGGFATMTLAQPRQVDPVTSQRQIHNDAVPRLFRGLLYLVNRFDGDSIQLLDPKNEFATLSNCTTGGGSNPHDIAVLNGDKAYVTLYGKSDLLIVNPRPLPDCTDFILDRIDLASFADDDGIPEMDQMVIVRGMLYVTVQRLLNFAPAGPGGVVVIDTATDEVVDSIQLTGQQPFAVTKGIVVRNNQLVIGQVGSFGVLDGGIETVDLPDGTANGFIITEEELGGDLNDFVIVSDDVGYAIVSSPDFTTSFLQFDPSRGVVTNAILSNVEFLADVELNDRGELFLLDRSFSKPGVRIFSASNGEQLTDEPIDVGLPPSEIVFLN